MKIWSLYVQGESELDIWRHISHQERPLEPSGILEKASCENMREVSTLFPKVHCVRVLSVSGVSVSCVPLWLGMINIGAGYHV